MKAPMRWTRQRRAVWEVLRRAQKHLTVQEIFDRVREQMPGIAYGTIYNALTYLRDAGFVRELNVGRGPTRYDRRLEAHGHAVCRSCGKMVDYEMPELEAVRERAAQETGFLLEGVHLVFEGLCPDCQRAGRRPRP